MYISIHIYICMHTYIYVYRYIHIYCIILCLCVYTKNIYICDLEKTHALTLEPDGLFCDLGD